MGYARLKRSKTVIERSSCVSFDVIDKKSEPGPSLACIWQHTPVNCLVDEGNRCIVC